MKDTLSEDQAPNPEWPFDEYWYCTHCGREWDVETETHRKTHEGKCQLHPWPAGE